MVAFVSGLLLGNDQTIRNWFALFIRTGQKHKGEVSSNALQQLRDELLRKLQAIAKESPEGQLPDPLVVQASALLRLYCSMRGIAGLKFHDDKVSSIVQLLVEDWLDDMSMRTGKKMARIGELSVVEAFESRDADPTRCVRMLQLLLKQEAIDIWSFAEIITHYATKMSGENVPRYVQDLFKDLWLKLNTVLPRLLWVLIVKNLVGVYYGLMRIDVAEDLLQIMRGCSVALRFTR